MYQGEKFNSISHLIGAILSLVGLGALLAVGVAQKNTTLVVSFAIFGLSLVVLYVCSTLYHSFRIPSLKKRFQKLDHAAIYLLIAGTYTPFMVVSLKDNNGYFLLALVWTLAIIGIAIDTLVKNRVELLQIAIYLVMGWICVIEIDALKMSLNGSGFQWLVLGGLLYSFGVVFYLLDDKPWMKYAHGIWHLFVLAGSMSHFVSIIGYVR